MGLLGRELVGEETFLKMTPKQRVLLETSITKSKSGEFLSERERLKRERFLLPLEQRKANTARLLAASDATRTSISLWQVSKPLLVGSLIFLFFVGPGLSAVLQVIGGMTWWAWIIAIILLIVVFRNRR